jgi:hypothetical protein
MTFEEAERILGKATSTNEADGSRGNTIATWIARDDSIFVIAFLADHSVNSTALVT